MPFPRGEHVCFMVPSRHLTISSSLGSPGRASLTSNSEFKCSLPGRDQCSCLFMRTLCPPQPLSGKSRGFLGLLFMWGPNSQNSGESTALISWTTVKAAGTANAQTETLKGWGGWCSNPHRPTGIRESGLFCGVWWGAGGGCTTGGQR